RGCGRPGRRLLVPAPGRPPGCGRTLVRRSSLCPCSGRRALQSCRGRRAWRPRSSGSPRPDAIRAGYFAAGRSFIGARDHRDRTASERDEPSSSSAGRIAARMCSGGATPGPPGGRADRASQSARAGLSCGAPGRSAEPRSLSPVFHDPSADVDPEWRDAACTPYRHGAGRARVRSHVGGAAVTTVRTLGGSVLLHGAALGTAVWPRTGGPRPARPALAVELLPTEDAVAVETTPLPREAVVVESVEVEPPLAEPVEEELEVEAGAFDPRVEAIFVPPRDERRASAWLATARRPLAPPAAAAPAEPPAP